MKSNKFIYIYVATAGIGRMGFGSWVGDASINRSDGDDEGTFSTLSDALEDAGHRIEKALLEAPWTRKHLAWATPTRTSKKMHGDVHAIKLSFDDFDFVAQWVEDVIDGDEPTDKAEGPTPSAALRTLGIAKENTLAHRAWVDEQR